MPTKQTADGSAYEVDGKTFIWYPLDDSGERGNLTPIRIPMRMKIKLIRDLLGKNLDAAAMLAILERIIPGQSDALDEMDLLDLQDCFKAWQVEYEKLSGASLGE